MGVISKSRVVSWSGIRIEAWVVGSKELKLGREVWGVGSDATESECEITKSESEMGIESGKEWAGVVEERQSEVQEELELT